VEARRRLDRYPFDLQLAQSKLLLDQRGHAQTQIAALALDATLAVFIRERRCGVAVVEDDRAALLDPIECRRSRRAGRKCTSEQHAEDGERCGKAGEWANGKGGAKTRRS